MKRVLTAAPILARPEFELPFRLQTDANSTGLGAALTQVLDGEERVIAYASRTVTRAERNYTVTEQECLAVVWAVNKFRAYLEGYHFEVITDHSSLRWLYGLKDPSGRLARWALQLLQYDFTITHRKDALHHVPDALCRMYEPDPLAVLTIAETDDPWYLRRLQMVPEMPKQFPDWKVEDERLYCHRPNAFTDPIIPDLEAWKLVLPLDLRNKAIEEAHAMPASGRLGIEKTHARLALLYYWPGMLRDVATYVRACKVCQQMKVEQAGPAGLMGKRVIEQPWTIVAADIVGPFPLSRAGFSYILGFQDMFTKWIEIIPLRKANGRSVQKAFEDTAVFRWGTPEILFTDNGTEFANNLIAKAAAVFGIRHTTTPPYHAQANLVERVNRVLKTMIASFVENDRRSWDKLLPDFRFAYNTAVHSSTHVSPAFLNFGREPRVAKSLIVKE